MSRKSVLLGIGIFVLLVGTAAGSVVALLHHEPEFYRRSTVPPGDVRVGKSVEFEQRLTQLLGDLQGDQQWVASFTDEQLNCYFEEGFCRSRLDETMLPEGISAPRIGIEPDKMRLAFRYGSGVWSTIITIDLRMWLAPKEPNVVALELLSFHAGSLPITAQSLLEQVSEVGRRRSIDVSWYRHQGNPVALLRFQADRERPTVQLQLLELQQGQIMISGRSVEASPLRAMLSPAPGL